MNNSFLLERVRVYVPSAFNCSTNSSRFAIETQSKAQKVPRPLTFSTWLGYRLPKSLSPLSNISPIWFYYKWIRYNRLRITWTRLGNEPVTLTFSISLSRLMTSMTFSRRITLDGSPIHVLKMRYPSRGLNRILIKFSHYKSIWNDGVKWQTGNASIILIIS